MLTCRHRLVPALTVLLALLTACGAQQAGFDSEPIRESSALGLLSVAQPILSTTQPLLTVSEGKADAPAQVGPLVRVSIQRQFLGTSVQVVSSSELASVTLQFTDGTARTYSTSGTLLRLIHPANTAIGGVEVVLRDGSKWYFDSFGQPLKSKWYADTD